MSDDERDIRALLESEAERAPRPEGLRSATVRRGMGRRIGAVALPLLVVASVAWVAIAQPFAPDPSPNVVGPGPESEDGLIAFVTQGPKDPSPWVAVLPAAGGEVIRLHEGRDPAWSPDGTRIAFGCDRGICTMNADGSDVIEVTDPPSPGYDEQPDWGPNGTIAFTRNYQDERGRDVLMIPEEGGREEVLGQQGPDDSSPTWSPDGREIAFIRGVGEGLEAPTGGRQLFVASAADPQEERQLTTDGAERPDWSPDGRSILFDNEPALWTIPAEGGSPRRSLVHTGEGSQVDTSGSWAPDSRRIAFSCEQGICLSDIDSEERTVLVTNGGSPAWQPTIHPSDEQPGIATFGRYSFSMGGGFDDQGRPVKKVGIVEVDSAGGTVCVESQILGASSAHLHRYDAPDLTITVLEPPTEYRPTLCARGLDPPTLQDVINNPMVYLIEFHNENSGGTLTAPLEIMGEPEVDRSEVSYCVGDGICLSRSGGPAGIDVTASVPASGIAENGVDEIRTERVEWWWGLEGEQWIDVLEGNPPEGAFLLAVAEAPRDDHLATSFIVPSGNDPGTYPIFAISYSGDGAHSASGMAIKFEVIEGYGCPTLLEPGPNAEDQMRRVVNSYLTSRQPEGSNGYNYGTTRMDHRIEGGPESDCSAETWRRSFQVDGSFEWKDGVKNPSASLAYFRFVVGRAKGDWVVWAVAH